MTTDPTTVGFEAEPTDVAAYLAELDDGAFGDDPVPTYIHATRLQVLHQAVADGAARRRAIAAARMHAAGLTFQQIADATNLSRARAQQLVERGRAALQAESL